MKRRAFISFIFFIITIYNVWGQTEQVDSLQALLPDLPADSTKVKVLNRLAFRLHTSQPSQSVLYATEAIEISEKENYTDFFTESYDAIAAANWVMGRYEVSIEYLMKKLYIHKQENDTPHITQTYLNIAGVLMDSNNDSLAFMRVSGALILAQQTKDTSQIGQSLNMIGNIYNTQQQYDSALAYWNKALFFLQKANNERLIAYVRNNIGLHYLREKQYDSALAAFENSLEVCVKINDKFSITKILRNIGLLHLKKGDYAISEKYLITSLDSAIAHQQLRPQMDAYKYLIQLDTITGNYQRATRHYQQYALLKDSIFSLDKEAKINQLQAQVELERHKNENQLLRRQEEFNFLVIKILVLTLLVISGFSVWLYFTMRQKRKANALLQEKNAEINAQKKQIEQQHQQLLNQHQELEAHRNNLQSLVNERTAALKAAKEKAEESSRLKTAFLNNISHEFRTPMNGIIGFSELLCEAPTDSANKTRYAGIIKKSCNRLITITDNVVDIAHIQTNQIELKTSLVNVQSLISALIQEYKNDIKEKALELRVSFLLKNDEIMIRTDREKLRKIYQHLIDNAVKFTHKGSIHIRCQKMSGKWLEFEIEDTGIGVNNAIKEAIFRPFWQHETGISRQYEGNGLGLPIAKAYAEFLGGSIRFLSEAGKGSVFTVEIPYQTKGAE